METKKSFFVEGLNDKLKIKHIDSAFDLEHDEIQITTKAAGYFKEGIKVGKVKKHLMKFTLNHLQICQIRFMFMY